MHFPSHELRVKIQEPSERIRVLLVATWPVGF